MRLRSVRSLLGTGLRAGATLAALTLVPAALSAQTANDPFIKGSRVASVGVMTGGDYEGSGVAGMLEFGVLSLPSNVQLGLGGFLGFQRDEDRFAAGRTTTTIIPAMAIGNLHFPVPSQPRLDLYAGASVGMLRISQNSNLLATGTSSFSNTELGIGIQGGARFRLASSVSLMGQIGIGDIPLLFAGLSFKY